MSASQLRDDLVEEEVFRALVIQVRRGVVRRVTDQPGRGANCELTCRVRPLMPEKSRIRIRRNFQEDT